MRLALKSVVAIKGVTMFATNLGMVKGLLIAAVFGACAAVCRGGDFGDPLPLDQRVAALEKDVAELKKKLAGPAVGKPVVSPVLPKTAPQPVAVRPAVAVSSSHNCPNCGAGPWYTITGNGPGGHQHTCGNCGTTFSHAGVTGASPDVAYYPALPVTYHPVGAVQGGCVNGQCSTTSGYVQYQRPGLLGRIFNR